MGKIQFPFLRTFVLVNLEIFLIFPNFLRLQVLNCLAIREATPIYHVYC